MLKFSPANAKTKALRQVAELQPYLEGKRKIYSLDLLSGHFCPFANDCLSKAVVVNGKRKIQDGPNTQFRCFSASQEVLFTGVYNLRKHNSDMLRAVKTTSGIASLLTDSMPKNAGIIRIHVAGDFFAQHYFDAWIKVAESHPDMLFYAYTKSLPYWVKRLGQIPENLVLTASGGGRRDDLILTHGLRTAVVVFSEDFAAKRKLPIDHDDSHAAVPQWRDEDFALLIHGVQPKGSEAAKALKELKGNGSYNRKGVTS